MMNRVEMNEDMMEQVVGGWILGYEAFKKIEKIIEQSNALNCPLCEEHFELDGTEI